MLSLTPHKIEILQLNSCKNTKDQRPVRLTYDTSDKVNKIEIYVDADQKSQFLKIFPDKKLTWKNTAPHFLILKNLAAYQKSLLISENPSAAKSNINAGVNALAEFLKKICHASADLYRLVNNDDLDYLDHPDHQKWKEFSQVCKDLKTPLNIPSLKIAFLRNKLISYRKNVMNILNDYNKKCPLDENLISFKNYHLKKTSEYIQALEEFEQSVPTKSQIKKLFANQTQSGRLHLPALGSYLRSQAHTLLTDAVGAIDDITAARFEQLFAFSAHPLRKGIAAAKAALDQQQSAQASRFLNNHAPLPLGQLEALENADDSEDNAKGHFKKWLDVMPYIKEKSFLGNGIDGSEGLVDADYILCFYANGKKSLIKQPLFFYKLFLNSLTGKYGVFGILGALPIAIAAAIGLTLGMIIAMIADFSLFILQAAFIVVCSPVFLLGVLIDVAIQIPSFFTEKAEFSFSALAVLAALPIPPPQVHKFLRKISAVRLLKQVFLNLYSPSNIQSDLESDLGCRTLILDKIKAFQAEGVFNSVSANFFNFAWIAGFLHEKLKQCFNALREMRKTFRVMWEICKHALALESDRFQRKQQTKIIYELEKKIVTFREDFIAKFNQALTSASNECLNSENIVQSPKLTQSLSVESNQTYNSLHYTPLTEWKSKISENPVDSISEIGDILFREMLNPAFEQNPGLAVPLAVTAAVCTSSFFFPATGNLFLAKTIASLQYSPQLLAKTFMGKSLNAQLTAVTSKMMTCFLQWKLSYFSLEGGIALTRGDIEALKKLLENPEEITFSSCICIAGGYAMSLLPPLPEHINIQGFSYANPFLHAFELYSKGLYGAFSGTVNAIQEEAAEVTLHGKLGPNALELGFLGMKAAVIAMGLVSGTHSSHFTELNINLMQLYDDLRCAKPNIFDSNLSSTEKCVIINSILSHHKISDPDSILLNGVLNKIAELNNEAESLAKSVQSFAAPSGPIEVAPELTRNDLADKPVIQKFVRRRAKLKRLIKLIHDIETLGLSVEEHQNASYQSKKNAELFYDSLYFAFNKHNKSARKLGLFHEQLDGPEILHSFYNKHCYVGSSGWHKIIFGLLLFPFTWTWRGIKYLAGKPSNRHQVKKVLVKTLPCCPN